MKKRKFVSDLDFFFFCYCLQNKTKPTHNRMKVKEKIKNARTRFKNKTKKTKKNFWLVGVSTTLGDFLSVESSFKQYALMETSSLPQNNFFPSIYEQSPLV